MQKLAVKSHKTLQESRNATREGDDEIGHANTWNIHEITNIYHIIVIYVDNRLHYKTHKLFNILC